MVAAWSGGDNRRSSGRGDSWDYSKDVKDLEVEGCGGCEDGVSAVKEGLGVWIGLEMCKGLREPHIDSLGTTLQGRIILAL